MANIDTLPPPPTNQVDHDLAEPAMDSERQVVHLSGEIKEQGVFASLVSSIRDVFASPSFLR